jgi:hypothetical protein
MGGILRPSWPEGAMYLHHFCVTALLLGLWLVETLVSNDRYIFSSSPSLIQIHLLEKPML